jgi:hypothetical protein
MRHRSTSAVDGLPYWYGHLSACDEKSASEGRDLFTIEAGIDRSYSAILLVPLFGIEHAMSGDCY